jgi:antitoxin ParD1/3/4
MEGTLAGRTSKPVTVTLGDLLPRVERRVSSGDYASVSEVMRAGVRALDREEAAMDALLRVRIEQARADPRPAIPLADAFAAVRAGFDVR